MEKKNRLFDIVTTDDQIKFKFYEYQTVFKNEEVTLFGYDVFERLVNGEYEATASNYGFANLSFALAECTVEISNISTKNKEVVEKRDFRGFKDIENFIIDESKRIKKNYEKTKKIIEEETKRILQKIKDNENQL
jgi:hypothetical protein